MDGAWALDEIDFMHVHMGVQSPRGASFFPAFLGEFYECAFFCRGGRGRRTLLRKVSHVCILVRKEGDGGVRALLREFTRVPSVPEASMPSFRVH